MCLFARRVSAVPFYVRSPMKKWTVNIYVNYKRIVKNCILFSLKVQVTICRDAFPREHKNDALVTFNKGNVNTIAMTENQKSFTSANCFTVAKLFIF